jgi:uridine phosphorylase
LLNGKKSAKELQYKYFKGIDRCHDAFYENIRNMTKWGNTYNDKRMRKWPVPLVSSEMECSVIFLIPMLRGLKAGAVLTVVTTEPLNKIAENPDLAYELIETPLSKKGIENSIKVALLAITKLEANANLNKKYIE